MMTVKLFVGAILKFVLGVALVGVLIFLPAGTLAFFNGWLLMAILFVPMFCAGFLNIITIPAPNMGTKRIPISSQPPK